MIIDSYENKKKILERFLEFSQFDGWNEETIAKSIEYHNIDSKFLNLIFENGCIGLIDFYIDEQNKNLLEKISLEPNFQSMKIREKIKFCLIAIFENEKNHQLSLHRLKNFYLNIKNFSSIEIGVKPMITSVKHVAKISDFIWKAIKDQSTDFNYYTKRLTLSKIIIKVFNVFILDKSQDLSDTRAAIEKEIEKVMKFEKFKNEVKNSVNKIKEKSCQAMHDKSLKSIINNLPFIRLFK